MFHKLPRRLFVHAAVAIAAIVLISSPSRGQTFDAALFESEVGDWWIYRLNGVQDVVLTVIGTESIGGVLAQVSRWDGGPYDGLESSASFDSVNGERLWKNFDPSVFVDGVGFVSLQQLFDPPVNTAPPTITIGDSLTSSGSFTQTFSNNVGSVTQAGTYGMQSLFALIEPIEVPFGEFNAIQVQTQIDLSVEVAPGVTNEASATTRDWLAPGLGVIRSEAVLPTGIDVFELVDTNREFVPEPSASLLQFSVVAALVVLRMRRREGHSLDEPPISLLFGQFTLDIKTKRKRLLCKAP
jgi:hypothetical protein